MKRVTWDTYAALKDPNFSALHLGLHPMSCLERTFLLQGSRTSNCGKLQQKLVSNPRNGEMYILTCLVKTIDITSGLDEFPFQYDILLSLSHSMRPR